MLWQDHQTLAAGLRDQGLADCLVAHFCLRDDDLSFPGRRMTLAHVVVAKSQQSIEKVVKGWLLWQSASFDPTKGHTPFTRELEQPELRPPLKRLLLVLGRLNPQLVRQIKWLEGLAPHPPGVPEGQRGFPQPLTIIPENTEYPFWSVANNRLLTSAEGIPLRPHGVDAFKAARTFLKAMAASDPKGFTEPIAAFLERYHMSTDIRESL